MLVPVIFILILSVLINRAAKKLNTSSAAPLMVSILVYVVFVVATRDVIRVQADEIAMGIFLATLMYIVVAAAIYAGAFMWMKKKSSPPKEEQ